MNLVVKDLLLEIEMDKVGKQIGFGRGYSFDTPTDLKGISKDIPEGIAVCSSSLAAGREHLGYILCQAAESWARSYFLARNRSLDLLMRLSCQRQISRALELSQIENISACVLYGLTGEIDEISFTEQELFDAGARRDDFKLDLDSEKASLLKRIHLLPDWTPLNQLPLLLQEKSIALNFQK